MGESEINPDKVMIGHLVANIARLQASRADRFMEQIGLYRGQAILLLILSHKDGLTHSEIAGKLEISPAAVTKVIKRLEELKYLQRQPDPADERISRVFLEEEGWAVIHQIKDAFQQIDQILLGNLSQEEQNTLFKLLMQVYSNLLTRPLDPS